MPALTLILVWHTGFKNFSLHLSPPFVFLFLLLIWGGVGLVWAIHFPQALKVFVTMSLTFSFALVLISLLEKATPDTVLKAYHIVNIAGFILISLILFQNTLDAFHIQLFKKYKDYYIMKPSGSILGLGAFITCGWLWVYNNKSLSVATFILLIFLIYLTRCQTALYGILFASFVFIISYIVPIWTTRAALVSSYTVLILTPFIYLCLFPLSQMMRTEWILQHPSLFHRFLGWDFLSKKFLEKFFLGWGLGATPSLYIESSLAHGYSNVMHPHNSSLQTYLELGLGGGILFALFFASLFWMVEKYVKDRLSIAVCNATLAFWFIQAELTHNLWHNHWVSWSAFLSGLLILFLKARALQQHGSVDRSMQAPIRSTE